MNIHQHVLSEHTSVLLHSMFWLQWERQQQQQQQQQQQTQLLRLGLLRPDSRQCMQFKLLMAVNHTTLLMQQLALQAG
jgi:hypothetical protein